MDTDKKDPSIINIEIKNYGGKKNHLFCVHGSADSQNNKPLKINWLNLFLLLVFLVAFFFLLVHVLGDYKEAIKIYALISLTFLISDVRKLLIE